jgi:hypothetical protein
MGDVGQKHHGGYECGIQANDLGGIVTGSKNPIQHAEA